MLLKSAYVGYDKDYRERERERDGYLYMMWCSSDYLYLMRIILMPIKQYVQPNYVTEFIENMTWERIPYMM